MKGSFPIVRKRCDSGRCVPGMQLPNTWRPATARPRAVAEAAGRSRLPMYTMSVSCRRTASRGIIEGELRIDLDLPGPFQEQLDRILAGDSIETRLHGQCGAPATRVRPPPPDGPAIQRPAGRASCSWKGPGRSRSIRSSPSMMPWSSPPAHTDIVYIGNLDRPAASATALGLAVAGRQVFGKLHARDTTTAVARFLTWGTSLHDLGRTGAIIAQRQVRKLCERCKETDDKGEPGTRHAARLLRKTKPPQRSFTAR